MSLSSCFLLASALQCTKFFVFSLTIPTFLSFKLACSLNHAWAGTSILCTMKAGKMQDERKSTLHQTRKKQYASMPMYSIVASLKLTCLLTQLTHRQINVIDQTIIHHLVTIYLISLYYSLFCFSKTKFSISISTWSQLYAKLIVLKGW